LEFGAALIGLSVWGVALCRGIFRVSLGPDALPGDSSFANLGIWAAWALFFGPLTVAGVATVWSTLRKMSALDQVATWLSDRAVLPDALLVNTERFGGIVHGGEIGDPLGLENLSAETVKRLQRIAARAATILGGSQGFSCWVLESLD
jgi:hypothetical protein